MPGIDEHHHVGATGVLELGPRLASPSARVVGGGTAVGGTALGVRVRAARTITTTIATTSATTTATAAAAIKRENAVARAAFLREVEPSLLLAESFGGDANVLGRSPRPTSAGRRTQRTQFGVAYVTAHQREDEVPHRLVGLPGRARLAHVRADRQCHQLAGRLHARRGQRIEVAPAARGLTVNVLDSGRAVRPSRRRPSLRRGRAGIVDGGGTDIVAQHSVSRTRSHVSTAATGSQQRPHATATHGSHHLQGTGPPERVLARRSGSRRCCGFS